MEPCDRKRLFYRDCCSFFSRHPHYVKCVQTLCKMLHKLSFAANCIHCLYCYCYSMLNEYLALLTSFNGFRYRWSQFCHCITTFYEIQYISISSNWKTIFNETCSWKDKKTLLAKLHGETFKVLSLKVDK